jgi:hypothetical protein
MIDLGAIKGAIRRLPRLFSCSKSFFSSFPLIYLPLVIAIVDERN